VAIRKQEFYEGAALHLAARSGHVTSLRYEPPFFYFNDKLSVMLKYSTKGRSPWSFTFSAEEQAQLDRAGLKFRTAIGLICGSDGVAAFDHQLFKTIGATRTVAIHIACYRDHGEHYEVSGPDGALEKKVARTNWLRLLGE